MFLSSRLKQTSLLVYLSRQSKYESLLSIFSSDLRPCGHARVPDSRDPYDIIHCIILLSSRLRQTSLLVHLRPDSLPEIRPRRVWKMIFRSVSAFNRSAVHRWGSVWPLLPPAYIRTEVRFRRKRRRIPESSPVSQRHRCPSPLFRQFWSECSRG